MKSCVRGPRVISMANLRAVLEALYELTNMVRLRAAFSRVAHLTTRHTTRPQNIFRNRNIAESKMLRRMDAFTTMSMAITTKTRIAENLCAELPSHKT